MAQKDDQDPSNTSSAYEAMAPKWAMVETLLAGTEAMREAGTAYLPRHEEESEGNYQERLGRATLFNMLELTLESLVGRPFSEPIEIPEDGDMKVPDEVKNLFANIDLQGSTLDEFCRNWFRDGLAKGIAHVFIDMPVIPARDADDPPRTLADDIAEARRPHWAIVHPENLIFAYADIDDGHEVLEQIRIYSCKIGMSGFLETFTPQIKVIEPGHWTLYELQQVKGKKKTWVPVDAGDMGIDEIPLVTFYANRKDFMLAKPPLEDLAHLNVRHWQSTADQISILTVARYPMLAASGVSDQAGSAMAIGPRQMLTMKDPTGKFYYVEHDGKAIEAGRQDLLDIEEMMANYGAEFLRRRPGGATATSRTLDTAEAISPLEDIVMRFNVTVNSALKLTGKWMDVANVGAIHICSDFGPDGIVDADLRTLVASLNAHAISVETYLKELQRRGLLDDDMEPKSELARIMKEGNIPGTPSPLGAGRPVGATTGGSDGVSGTGKGSGGVEKSGTGAGGLS